MMTLIFCKMKLSSLVLLAIAEGIEEIELIDKIHPECVLFLLCAFATSHEYLSQ